jgi:hypothetical protein
MTDVLNGAVCDNEDAKEKDMIEHVDENDGDLDSLTCEGDLLCLDTTDVSDAHSCPCASPTSPLEHDLALSHCIILDWDDTLMASSELERLFASKVPNEKPTPHNIWKDEQFVKDCRVLFRGLELKVVQLIASLKLLGEIHIVTNSTEGWVQFSCQHLMPLVWESIKNLPIFSARTMHELAYPNDYHMWKLLTFKSCVKLHHKFVLSIGDNPIDYKAALSTGTYYNLPVKNIKFILQPSLQGLENQISHIIPLLFKIYQSPSHVIAWSHLFEADRIQFVLML